MPHRRPPLPRRSIRMMSMTTTVTAAETTAAPTNPPQGAGGEFLRIGEMARTFGVTLRALRFYEDKGLLQPQRDGTTRLYTRSDRVRLKLILLGRKVGFSLREVKQMMDLYDPTGANTRQLRLALEKSEKQLLRLQKQRALVDDAIAELERAMAAVRIKLAEHMPAARA